MCFQLGKLGNFSFSNAIWYTGLQFKESLFFFFPARREFSGFAMSAKPSMNSLQNLTMPKNDHRAVTDTGTGSLWIIST